MRISIGLSIAVFVSTLYWPQLLNYSGILYCVLSVFIFICWPRWRTLVILPLTAAYFSLFTQVTLLGVSVDSTNVLNILQNKPSLTSVNKQHASFFTNALNGKDNIITVQVKSLINSKNNGYFIANIISINNQHCIYCPLIEMRWFKPILLVQAGQVHQFKASIKPLQGKANPNGFDRQKWRYSNHIAYIANIRTHLQTIDPSISLRAYLYQKVLHASDKLEQQGAIIALSFADKSLLSDDEKQLIKQLGIAHLFAISGLHIGLLFVFSFFIFNLLLKRILPISLLGWFSWRLIYLLSFCVCLSYGYISGFSLPTQRALLMLFISVLMFSVKRKISLFDLLILCLWIILLVDPLAILSSSLWLSFTAISIILLFVWSQQKPQKTQKVEADMPAWWEIYSQKCISFIKWLLLLQLILTIFMLPIQLLNFSAVSLFSFIINLIAIPLFSWFIIPITLLGTLLVMLVEPIGVFLLMISDYLLIQFMYYFSELSEAYLLLSDLTIKLMLSVFIFSLLVALFIYLQSFFLVKRRMLLLSILVFSFIGFIVVRIGEIGWEKQNTWQVEVFDVGQGLAVLIQSEGKYLLYDTGPSYPPNYATAEFEILPYLQAKGIRDLDYLIVSHSDNDHAGGANIIQQSLKVKKAYAGEALKMHSFYLDYQQCITGQQFILGKLSVVILSPSVVSKNNNNNSCVLKISDGKNSLLLTGDISHTIEQALIYNALQNNNSEILKADILIAPHHGSKSSSSEAFIRQVNPSWVVFPAGYRNRWNFPALQVVQRYQQQGAKQLTTGNTGFIRFNVQNQHIEVKTYREDLAAYWYHRHPAL
ncbi:DNA internalization-related competence protein ComEC/Rec2 [Psychromonas sp. RZ22]|uniref:DNA internalization-related competence protein ComEC/Rec2 n=1 Tax=Psychromonas algarum TaxID=2555643 RepID=UPI001067867A|nr:DNA internalization-related competence protein ComEC/Rec2 [Psychromonas sp. RZ22]TEW56003.1 DNA internalization-related competence protein ComEC/Rec2 [Psychromonas sp. RZ22]